jgi:hypothetical protein
MALLLPDRSLAVTAMTSLYELTRQDPDHPGETLETVRKFGGFYAGYRLVKLGKPI